MALNASIVWRIRVSGNLLNGGGYDAAVVGAGTDYTDQDGPQLSLTDLVSTASTTVTSVIGGFTAAMVGNVLRLASGTGTPTVGYYVITTYVDTNTITVDRVSGTYTLGVGRVGGAFATLEQLASSVGAGLTAPALTSPLAAGHTVMIRGAGTDTPSSNDYDYTGANKYVVYASGDATSGKVYVLGYNGRPRIGAGGLLFHTGTGHVFENLSINIQGTSNVVEAVFSDTAEFRNIFAEQNNNDISVLKTTVGVFDSAFINSGVTPTAGTYPAINTFQYGAVVQGCFIKNWRGGGIILSSMGKAVQNVITGTKSHGIILSPTGSVFKVDALYNTIYNNTGDGIRITSAANILDSRALYNIVANNGGYGLNLTVGSQALNDRTVRGLFDYNNFYLNTSGARSNISAGTHDTALDPQFTNAAGDDYSIGANLKGLGFPGLLRGSSSTGYLDLGAVQRLEAASGGGGFVGM